MSIRPIPPPVGIKLLNEDGTISLPWSNFFNAIYRFELAIDSSVSDGTYTLGTGTEDGEITITNGIITAIQEVS